MNLFWLFLMNVFVRIFTNFRKTIDPYTVILLIGTMGVFLVFAFDFFFYSEAFIRGEYLLFLFYYLCSIALKRKQNISVGKTQVRKRASFGSKYAGYNVSN